MQRASTLGPLLLLAAAPLAAAQAPVDPQEKLRQDKQTAITKGTRWLVEQQQRDGSWTYDDKPLSVPGYPMDQGSTALAAFALLKCGLDPADPIIERAFTFIRGKDLRYTYAVSCVLLAIEARANPDARADEDDGPGTSERKRRRPPSDDLELARRCVDFICQHQQVGLWRYPSKDQEDVSNAQYALLALDAAERLGIEVPKDVYVKVVTRLVEAQEKDGPVVPTFPVPGADKTFRELRDIQEDLEKEIRSIERKFKKEDDGRDKEGQTQADRTATAERGAAKRIFETAERGAAMKARGWSYFLPGTPGEAWQTTPNGSMTASGLAALFICKSRLEGTPRWEQHRAAVDKALRDGAAWLAHNYSVTRNPGSQYHYYYYMYGFERAGILGLIPRFGERDWYTEGCEAILRAQLPTGAWNAGANGTSGPIPDTCFGLLFLARGTTPVVKVPRRVMTGPGAPQPPATPPR